LAIRNLSDEEKEYEDKLEEEKESESETI